MFMYLLFIYIKIEIKERADAKNNNKKTFQYINMHEISPMLFLFYIGSSTSAAWAPIGRKKKHYSLRLFFVFGGKECASNMSPIYDCLGMSGLEPRDLSRRATNLATRPLCLATHPSS